MNCVEWRRIGWWLAGEEMEISMAACGWRTFAGASGPEGGVG